MDAITSEIERALQAGLYYVAVAMALSLPDVCAALESPNGATTNDKYKDWYDAWLASGYSNITRDDMYSLRCGVLHQGRMGHPKMQYGRVVFTVNERHGIVHNNVMKDALQLSAATFCRDVLAAVAAWYAAKKDDANVVANLPRLVQFRPNGMAPYIRGVPVIA